MTQILEILVGLPASGKSTYAKRLEASGAWRRINWDRYRWYDSAGNPKPYVFNKENEQFIKNVALGAAEIAANSGYNIVVDNTNLTASARLYWMAFASEHNLHTVVTQIDTPLEECLRRNKLRTGWQRVPRAVVEWMALTNSNLDGTNRVTFPADKETVIVDIDGTLADSSDRQKYISGLCSHDLCTQKTGCHCGVCGGTGKQKKDWKRFFAEVSQDKPNQAVAEWVRSLEFKYNVVIVSGRPVDQCGHATEDWLDKWSIPYDRLYMRPGGNEDDTVVKQRILDALKPHCKFAFAIDDRPRVIRMWRENGIKTYDVGKGVEF